jgi:hypothetical protein
LLLELGAIDDDETTEDEIAELLARDDEAAEEDIGVAQAAPLITGTSAVAAPFVPCTPNSTVWLGWMVLFQVRFLAL